MEEQKEKPSLLPSPSMRRLFVKPHSLTSVRSHRRRSELLTAKGARGGGAHFLPDVVCAPTVSWRSLACRTVSDAPSIRGDSWSHTTCISCTDPGGAPLRLLRRCPEAPRRRASGAHQLNAAERRRETVTDLSRARRPRESPRGRRSARVRPVISAPAPQCQSAVRVYRRRRIAGETAASAHWSAATGPTPRRSATPRGAARRDARNPRPPPGERRGPRRGELCRSRLDRLQKRPLMPQPLAQRRRERPAVTGHRRRQLCLKVVRHFQADALRGEQPLQPIAHSRPVGRHCFDFARQLPLIFRLRRRRVHDTPRLLAARPSQSLEQQLAHI